MLTRTVATTSICCCCRSSLSSRRRASFLPSPPPPPSAASPPPAFQGGSPSATPSTDSSSPRHQQQGEQSSHGSSGLRSPTASSSSSLTTASPGAQQLSPPPSSSSSSTFTPNTRKQQQQHIAGPLPPSSFQQLLSRTKTHLADPALDQPDAHAEHSEVGRAFVGELRDVDGNVVDGKRLGDLATRLAVLGAVRREMGPIEKITFLPDRAVETGPLQSQDRFDLVLASPPRLPPPTPLRSHPLLTGVPYLPPQPGYAFPLTLPRWAHLGDRTVGGPSLEQVVRLGVGLQGDPTRKVLPAKKVLYADMVENSRKRGDGLVVRHSQFAERPARPQVERSEEDEGEGEASTLAAEEDEPEVTPSVADDPVIGRSEPPTSTSSSTTTAEADLADLALYPDQQRSLALRDRQSALEQTEAEREALIERSLSFTLVLSQLSSSTVRRPVSTYPPSMTFRHPYRAITNLSPIRAFETRLWPALRIFDGFSHGLARAREAMIRRLGMETLVDDVEAEKDKKRAGDQEIRQRMEVKRNLPPHLRTELKPSMFAPLTAVPPRGTPSPPPNPAGSGFGSRSSLPPPPSTASAPAAPPPPSHEAPPRTSAAAATADSPVASDSTSSTPSPTSSPSSAAGMEQPSSPEPIATNPAPRGRANESSLDIALPPPSSSPAPQTPAPSDLSPSTSTSSSSSSSPVQPDLDNLYAQKPALVPYLSVPSLASAAAEKAKTVERKSVKLGLVEEERRAAAVARSKARESETKAGGGKQKDGWLARLLGWDSSGPKDDGRS